MRTIATTVARECRSDLDGLVVKGPSSITVMDSFFFIKSDDNERALITLSILAAKGYFEMSDDVKNALRARGAQLSKSDRSSIGKLLRGQRKDHKQGITLLLAAIRKLDSKFDSWEGLSRVLATAFEEAGKDSVHITNEMLRKLAKRQTGEKIR